MVGIWNCIAHESIVVVLAPVLIIFSEEVTENLSNHEENPNIQSRKTARALICLKVLLLDATVERLKVVRCSWDVPCRNGQGFRCCQNPSFRPWQPEAFKIKVCLEISEKRHTAFWLFLIQKVVAAGSQRSKIAELFIVCGWRRQWRTTRRRRQDIGFPWNIPWENMVMKSCLDSMEFQGIPKSIWIPSGCVWNSKVLPQLVSLVEGTGSFLNDMRRKRGGWRPMRLPPLSLTLDQNGELRGWEGNSLACFSLWEMCHHRPWNHLSPESG